MNTLEVLNRAIASGICGANESFTSREMLFLQGEVESRTEGIKALSNLPDVTEVKNTTLYEGYDFEITSADTKVLIEHKDRGFRKFNNDDLVLSPKKYRALLDLSKKAKEEGKECWFTSTRFGSFIYIWDMAEAPTYVYFAPLTHKKYTVDASSPTVEEEMVFFPENKAKFIIKYSDDFDYLAD